MSAVLVFQDVAINASVEQVAVGAVATHEEV